MNIYDIIKECDVKCIKFSSNDNRLEELDELMNERFSTYDQFLIVELFKNSINTTDGISQTITEWNDFVKTENFKNVLRDVVTKLSEINPNEKVEDADNQCPFRTEEELDAACELGDLQLDDWLCEAHANRNSKGLFYKNLVLVAPTGKGKSKKLAKWLAHSNDKLQSGILLTHSNKAAAELYDQVIQLNPDKINSIKIFNYEQNDYEELKRNPEILNAYNWVICYNQRLVDSDVDVLRSLIKNLRNKRRIRNDAKTYIISDESIMNAKIETITRADINRIDVMSNYAFTEYIKNPTESNRLKLVAFYQDLEDKVLDIKTPADLDDNEVVLLNSFTGRDVRNTNIFQLRVYLARFSTLLNYIRNRYDEFIVKYNNPKLDSFSYIINIDDLSDDGNDGIIIFDATGDINFGDKNDSFYLKRLCEVTKNIIDFNYIDIKIPQRSASIKEYDEFFENLKSSNFKFNDNSIILWYCDAWYTEPKEILASHSELSIINRMKKYLVDTGSKGCYVTYFNGAMIKGENGFRGCNNIYVLSNYNTLNRRAISNARAITGNLEFSLNDKFITDVLQCTGRTSYRNYKSSVNLDGQEAPVHFYFSEDIPSGLIARILMYYGLTKERIIYSDSYSNSRITWINILLDYLRLMNPESRYHSDKIIGQINYLCSKPEFTISELSVRFSTKDPMKALSKSLCIMDYLDLSPTIVRGARGRKKN